MTITKGMMDRLDQQGAVQRSLSEMMRKIPAPVVNFQVPPQAPQPPPTVNFHAPERKPISYESIVVRDKDGRIERIIHRPMVEE
jgi:hypothetical protein